MPRWPSQPPVESAAKRARKNVVKEATKAISSPDPHQSVVEALSTAEAIPLSVREMLCASLDGCLASSAVAGGKSMARHPFQDQLLGAVVDALETAETTMRGEVSEAEVALEALQAEMALCEGARQALELELAESSKCIEGQEKVLGDNADALEKARHALGNAEVALRQSDTEIGEAAMRCHQISQVMRLATSMSEKGAPDGECAKYLKESRHLIEPCFERTAEHMLSADPVAEDLAEEPKAVEEPVHSGAAADPTPSGKLDIKQSSIWQDTSSEKEVNKPNAAEPAHQDALLEQVASATPDAEQCISEENLVSDQPACDQPEDQSREEQPASEQLAEQMSQFSECATELESMVTQTAAARILRVAEVDAAQAECSTVLTKRSEHTTTLRESKQLHRQREVSLKLNEKDMKRIKANCEACRESLDGAQLRLKELQQGPLSKCRGVVASSVDKFAVDSINVVNKLATDCFDDVGLHAGGNVEMRIELVGAGC